MPCNCIDRATLKSYFKQCATPTEQSFAKLIDFAFNACIDDTICNNLLVEGGDGFNQDGETASLFLGDQNHSIQSKHGKGVSINTFGANDAFFIEQGTGNVGIGTTTPSKQLDVNGDANIQGTLCVDDLDVRGNVNVQGAITATSLNIAGSGLVPVGTIVMFNGNTAPTGWALCDGTNGTPDLRGRFIVGKTNNDLADYGYPNSEKNIPAYNSVGNIGGKREVKLTSQESGSNVHKHYVNITTDVKGNHVHTALGTERWDKGSGSGSDLGPHYSSGSNYTLVNPAGDHTHSVQGDTNDSSAADAQSAHENLPPFFVLSYMMKL